MMTCTLLAKAAVPALFGFTLLLSSGSRAAGAEVKHNIPSAVQQAVDLGPADLSEEMNLTVHLKSPNQAAFDAAVDELYNPASPKYEHWMTDAELNAYAPTAAQVSAVKLELQKHWLSVVDVDPAGFSIRVHGKVANIQQAFQTELHQFSMKNTTFRANVQDAHLTGVADSYVASVAGLSGGKAHPMAKRVINPRTGAPSYPLSKVNSSGGLGSIITDNCFTSPKTFTFRTPGASLPVAVYFGNDYDDSAKVCSFTSAQLQAHYGLPAAYAKGFDGTGETVVLLEAYGYPTMQADANAFSSLNGLPVLTSSNFEVVYPDGKPINPNAGVLTGWDTEIAIDIQWAHSIAPKAKIIVVAAAGQDNEDLQSAMSYIVKNRLGYSVSNSWGVDLDAIAGPLELDSFNSILQQAAARGISFNFATGDSGDNGLGTPIGASSVPSDSPYATAVGGTSILNKINGASIETGWGNDVALVNDYGPLDPPAQQFFGGAGGGESIYFPKPKWQGSIAGSGRQVPDISALADPNTGVPIVLTVSGTQMVQVGWGGTSLACPIFSAFWTLANQAAGHTLGEAAPKIAALTGSEVLDIVPHSSPTNVAGTIFDSNGATFYSPSDLFSLYLYDTTQFVSAIAPIASYEDFVISFGTDTSLTVTKGWDNVTGFGVPNGLPFILGAAGK